MTPHKVGDLLEVSGGGYIRIINPDWPDGDEPFCEIVSNYTWALVWLRPDGWWEAGRGWDTLHDARKEGEAHDWKGADWGIIKIPDDAPKIEARLELVFAAMFRKSTEEVP